MDNKTKPKKNNKKRNSDDDTINKTSPQTLKKCDVTSNPLETLEFQLDSEISITDDPLSVFTPTKVLVRSPPHGATSSTITTGPKDNNCHSLVHIKPLPRPRSYSNPERIVTITEKVQNISDLDFESPEQEKKKRKRGDSKGASSSHHTYSDSNFSIKALAQSIKDLSSFKTRGDVINDVKVVIARTVKLFNEMLREVKNSNRERSRSRQRSDSNTERESAVIDLDAESPKNPGCNSGVEPKTQETPPSTRTFGTQTSNPDVLEEEELNNYLNKENNYETVQTLLDREWSEHIYKKTKITNKDILTEDESDLACLIPSDLEIEGGPSKFIVDKFQVSKEMKTQNLLPGTCMCLINATCVPRGRKDTGPAKLLRERFVFYLINRTNARSPTNQEDTYRALVEMRETALDEGRDTISISCENSCDLKNLRKMIEVILLDTQIMATIHCDNIKKTPRWNLPGTETVVINSREKSFAETLKALKNEINVDKEGFSVAGIRSSRNGHVLVEIKGDTSKARSFSNLVNSRVSGARAQAGPRFRNKVLHLKHLEGDITVEDIKEAVATSLPDSNVDSILVKALRPAFAGRQNATLIAPSPIADKLLEVSSLRVGWGYCRIVEREELVQCYRCREYGHISKKCEGPDRSKLCRRCGADDHTSTQCKNPEKCILCTTEGHRDGSLKCPSYQKALKYRLKYNKNKDRDSKETDKQQQTNKTQIN